MKKLLLSVALMSGLFTGTANAYYPLIVVDSASASMPKPPQILPNVTVSADSVSYEEEELNGYEPYAPYYPQYYPRRANIFSAPPHNWFIAGSETWGLYY